MFDLASALFGSRGKPVAQGSTLTATGSAASAGGTAYLTMDADVTPAEGVGDDTDQTVIDVPTSPSVAEGDEVIMTLVGDGPLKTPVVMANPGFGDRMQAQVDNAETLATEAQEVAQATGQHFWTDEQGVHVTEVTQDEWNDSAGTSYHSGMNVLINALGQLFRDGLDNILAILSGTTPGLAIYDGSGNTADHILAEFAADHVRIGGNVPDGTGVESSVQFFDQTATHDTDMTASTYFDGDGSYQTMQSTVNMSSTLADEGKAIDTGSSGTAALDLVNMLENGISDVGEQHNEVHAALVADASYSDGATTSHAAVRATASTLNGSGLSYAELIADALGIGTSETSIDYVVMRQVLCALLRPSATYTPLVGTWNTGTANAWETAGFGVVVTESGRFTDYIDVTDKVVGEFTALVGCTVRVSACVTWVDSVAGRRSVGAFVNATRSGSRLSGGTEYSNSGLFYTGNNAKTAQLTPVILHLAAGNRLNIGKYAPANAIQSNQAYKMNWVTIEVLSVD